MSLKYELEDYERGKRFIRELRTQSRINKLENRVKELERLIEKREGNDLLNFECVVKIKKI